MINFYNKFIICIFLNNPFIDDHVSHKFYSMHVHDIADFYLSEILRTSIYKKI